VWVGDVALAEYLHERHVTRPNGTDGIPDGKKPWYTAESGSLPVLRDRRSRPRRHALSPRQRSRLLDGFQLLRGELARLGTHEHGSPPSSLQHDVGPPHELGRNQHDPTPSQTHQSRRRRALRQRRVRQQPRWRAMRPTRRAEGDVLPEFRRRRRRSPPPRRRRHRRALAKEDPREALRRLGRFPVPE
jgi:hypothetical protein